MRFTVAAAAVLALVFAAPAFAHHPVLDESAFAPPVVERSPFPPPPMTAAQERKWDGIVKAARQRAASKAHAAHFTYTYTQMWNNLMDTNLDRSCGWGANQYCPSDDPNRRPRAPFIGWVG